MVAFSGKIDSRLFENLEAAGFLAQLSDELVMGYPVQPRAGVIGKALGRPSRERRHEGGLNRVLHEFDMPHSDSAGENGHQPAVFVPEEMLNEDGCCQGLAISRISMLDPGIIKPGPSRATSSARS